MPFRSFGHHTSQPGGQGAPRARPAWINLILLPFPSGQLQKAAPDLPRASWSRERSHPGPGLGRARGVPWPQELTHPHEAGAGAPLGAPNRSCPAKVVSRAEQRNEKWEIFPLWEKGDKSQEEKSLNTTWPVK